MKRLLLLRHAKAVAASPKLDDHARALNERGREDAPRIGSYMQHKRFLPDVVLCSTAARTRETWEQVASELDNKPDIRFLDELYLASWKTIVNAIRSSGSGKSVLVVGHNPGLEECALELVKKPQTAPERERLANIEMKFPTAALAVIEFEIQAWKALELATGRLADFIRPKDLTDG